MVRGLALRNGQAVPLAKVPILAAAEFRDAVLGAVGAGCRLSAFLGRRLASGGVGLLAVLADDAEGVLSLLGAEPAQSFPALTPVCPQAHLFEREIFEQHGVRPMGHPWLKPVRFPPGGTAACGTMDFYRVHGEEVHEVAVGPVHAGVIEPGHFRFQCAGEVVKHLEISLGYQHRGVERALLGGPDRRSMHLMETLAGDTTVGHGWAYCQAVEALGKAEAPPRALALRAVALELERVANHIGDLGALAADVGFLPTQSYCGRLRGDALNITAMLCGSRFGRSLLRPGGVAHDADAALAAEMSARLETFGEEAASAVDLLWDSPSVTGRFEETGAVSLEDCRRLGLVGPAARACGLNLDVRRDLPFGIYRYAMIPVSSWHAGDVFGRAQVRWLEVQRSLKFARELLGSLPGGPLRREVPQLRPEHVAVSLTEGWRGEVCHVAMTDAAGRFGAYKVVDPSFHNWFALALALRGQQISDFPLCNKSFDLSYCGFDL
ncbi:MAG: NADH-quinone oxidoreductase subunit C [Elusimicrobia bacterium]|nr:NADH-quinone oxidoreductase subunit C [Elusimicrobiota bacterium]